MSDLKDKAQKLRIRVSRMRITHAVTIKSLADKIDYSEEYTAAVLRGKYESEALCIKLEAELDKIESEDDELKLAA